MEELGAGIAIVVFIVSLVIAISLHEAMHAFVSYALGDDTAKRQGRVTLNPLAHIDPFMTVLMPLILFIFFGVFIGAAKPVPFNPHNLRWKEYGMALVALAGPFTNLILALIGSLVLHLFVGSVFWIEVFIIFISLNVGLFVINMLPIPPLDGSRALYVIAPDSVRNLMHSMERFGLLLLLPLFFFFHEYITPLFNWVFDFVITFWPQLF